MTPIESAPILSGGELSTLDSIACQRYLAWLLDDREATVPEEAIRLDWALAHCDDGVTWGRYDTGEQLWRLGNQVAPEISPPIRRDSLQELRLFSEAGEVLIWRTDAGLRGRVLREGDTSDPLPLVDPRILRGDHVIAPCDHDFTHVGDRAGAEQVLPLAVTTEQLRTGQVCLAVRHYYESDAKTGAVRLAATRLVAIKLGGHHGD